jgi:hypothetical protein
MEKCLPIKGNGLCTVIKGNEERWGWRRGKSIKGRWKSKHLSMEQRREETCLHGGVGLHVGLAGNGRSKK